MISGHDVSVRIGPRELINGANFRLDKGMRVGLVGRNGAGKTTLTKILAAAAKSTVGDQVDQDTVEVSGQITVSGSVGYLPQDSHVGDPEQVALDRILSARGIAETVARIRKAEAQMSTLTGERQTKAMERYVRLDHEFTVSGGWAAHAEASQIAAALGLDKQVLSQQLGTLSGGQRRRVELARVLFSKAETLLLDEPTNHLDHDSIIWLRDYLRGYKGGFIVISHSVELLDETVNQVWYLDATRSVIDVYALGWSAYLKQRQLDEKRRKRERDNAEKKAAALQKTAARLGAKSTKASAAHNMQRRAEALLANTEGARVAEKVANLRFPEPAACGKVPLTASGLSMSYGSLEIFTDLDLAIDRGSRVVVLGLNGAGKTTLLKILAGKLEPIGGQVEPGTGLKLGYYAQEHDNLDLNNTVLGNMQASAPDLDDTQVRSVLGSFLFGADDIEKPASVLSGGEKTRLSLATLVISKANVLLLDEPTNNLDPASRAEILQALSTYQGAVVLVTHDPGAVEALRPDRVLLLPDGDEDYWSDDYLELVSLA